MTVSKIKKIFHIDDDPDVIEIAKILLSKNPAIKYQGFEDIEEFLSKVREDIPDLILIDLNIGKLQGAGFQIIEAIRNKISVEIPLIVLSKRRDIKDITHAIEVGADDFFIKPIDSHVFLPKINNYLDGFMLGDIGLFPFKKNPTKYDRSKIQYSLCPVKIDELQMHLLSDHLLTRGSKVRLSGELIEEVFGCSELPFYVHTSTADIDTGKFNVSLDFGDLSSNQQGRLNSWLLKTD